MKRLFILIIMIVATGCSYSSRLDIEYADTASSLEDRISMSLASILISHGYLEDKDENLNAYRPNLKKTWMRTIQRGFLRGPAKVSVRLYLEEEKTLITINSQNFGDKHEVQRISELIQGYMEREFPGAHIVVKSWSYWNLSGEDASNNSLKSRTPEGAV